MGAVLYLRIRDLDWTIGGIVTASEPAALVQSRKPKFSTETPYMIRAGVIRASCKQRTIPPNWFTDGVVAERLIENGHDWEVTQSEHEGLKRLQAHKAARAANSAVSIGNRLLFASRNQLRYDHWRRSIRTKFKRD